MKIIGWLAVVLGSLLGMAVMGNSIRGSLLTDPLAPALWALYLVHFASGFPLMSRISEAFAEGKWLQKPLKRGLTALWATWVSTLLTAFFAYQYSNLYVFFVCSTIALTAVSLTYVVVFIRTLNAGKPF
jgi:hypothetical protein